MSKKRWFYIFSCPICSKRVEVIADPGVTPDNPGMDFRSRCQHCHASIEFKARYLAQVER